MSVSIVVYAFLHTGLNLSETEICLSKEFNNNNNNNPSSSAVVVSWW